jgi:hypothetical protein
MVTVADDLEALYPVDNEAPIPVKGFINGNYGSFNRHWFNVNDGDEIPGSGVIMTTGDDGENTVDMWGANTELGYGVLGHDRTQLASTWTSSVVYGSSDIAPVYPFAENPGMYFQGYVTDTNGNWDANHYLDAGADGSFLTADLANRVYAYNLYYVADTTATAQLIMMYVASTGPGG